MTSTRDFQDSQEQAPGSTATSPVVEPYQGREVRLPSIASGHSYDSSGDTVRKATRRMSRSNTVKHAPNRPNWKPGAEPGIDTEKVDEKVAPHLDALHADCEIVVVDFSDEQIVSVEADNANLNDVLTARRPHNMPCRWISVNGLSWDVIKVLGKHYNLHRLAIEDLINVRSRTKVDWYSDHAFVVLTLQKLVRMHTHPDKPDVNCDCPEGMHTMLDGSQEAPHPARNSVPRWKKPFNRSRQGSVLPYFTSSPASSSDSLGKHDGGTRPIRTLHRYESSQNPDHTNFMEQNSTLSDEGLVVSVEQVAIFLMADNTVISFFEHSAADVEEPILDRLKSSSTMLRRSGDASLILQALVDAIVDLAIPVKEAYNSARKELQIDVLTNPSMKVSRSLHIFTEEIDMLQNLFKPIVNLVNSLRDHNVEPLLGVGPSNISSSAGGSSHASNRPNKTNGQGTKSPPPHLKRMQTSTSVVITPLAHVYLGDVLDHCLTIIQSLEQMDASANNLSNLMFNTISANTNNFMMIIALGESLWRNSTFETI